MKTLKLTAGTPIETSYTRSHDVEITASNGCVTVLHYDADDNETEIELECSITYTNGVMTGYEIYPDTEDFDVVVDRAFAQEIADQLMCDDHAELNW